MNIGPIAALIVVLLVLVIGLFALINDPKEIDAEEERAVEREIEKKKKKRWWRRG